MNLDNCISWSLSNLHFSDDTGNSPSWIEEENESDDKEKTDHCHNRAKNHTKTRHSVDYFWEYGKIIKYVPSKETAVEMPQILLKLIPYFVVLSFEIGGSSIYNVF